MVELEEVGWDDFGKVASLSLRSCVVEVGFVKSASSSWWWWRTSVENSVCNCNC